MKQTALIAAVLMPVILWILFGCAPPPAVEEKPALTPDRQKALEDSLRQVQFRELKIIRSFAYSHYKNKAWADAARYYTELAEKDTGHVFNDYGKWAQCYIQMNVSVDTVKMVYQQGIAAFPEDAYLHASLGHIFRTQGLLDSAVVHYEAAVQHNPEELDYRKTLAELYTRVDRPLEAIALYREVLAQEPDNKEIADILDGLIRRYLSPEEHIKSLEELVAQFPDDLEKKYDLAMAYMSVGQNQKALGLLEAIHQREPANVRYLEALGNVQQNLGNFGPAIRAYSKILDLEPDNARIMVEISNCYRQLNDYPQARTHARRALAKDPKMGAGYVALAAIYEAAADLKTQGRPPSYYDKLVFLVAYGLYLDAQQSGDYRVLDEASRHMRYLRESKLIPEYADWFMHQNDKDPTKGGGYDWINPGWPELRYIEKYLDEISRK